METANNICGLGRGRGWLNINKNNRPGISHNESNISNESSCPQQYANVITALEQLSETDDGILMNQKFKYIFETLEKECQTSTEVEECFNYVYKKCLENKTFAMKVMTLMSSYTMFTNDNIVVKNLKLRIVFVNQLQNSFQNAKKLQKSNPSSFRIAVQMLSCYYNRATVRGGLVLKVFIKPLIKYFTMLLDSAQLEDIEVFTVQFCLNGLFMNDEKNRQGVSELMNKTRRTLACNNSLCRTSKLLLMLVIDIANKNFKALPPELVKFYQAEIGTVVGSLPQLQTMFEALSIQTSPSTNKSLEKYESNVNVLQVSSSESPSSPPSSNELPNSNDKYNSSQSFAAPQPPPQSHPPPPTSSSRPCKGESPMTVGNWKTSDSDVKDANREKTGRPILGAGARFQKDDGGTSHWSDADKGTSANWSNEKFSAGKKTPPKYGRGGWEHDDRFDNDYN